MSVANENSVLNASSDSVASANFLALHEKINATEERLTDINEQTKKKIPNNKRKYIKNKISN